jgi:hypothetical protein
MCHLLCRAAIPTFLLARCLRVLRPQSARRRRPLGGGVACARPASVCRPCPHTLRPLRPVRIAGLSPQRRCLSRMPSGFWAHSLWLLSGGFPPLNPPVA